MRWLPIAFSNKPRLSLYILLALIPLIWLIAALSGISFATAATFTIMLLIVCIIILLAKQKEMKKSDGLKGQLSSMHADDQQIDLRPEARAEIELLQQKFVEMTSKIRQSELGKGLKGKKALYALPWFLTIGPFASGKSTLIKNSGLDFPLGIDEEVKGIGGTRICDWWFTNEAIILDTAGRYTSEREERAIWLALLDQLKRYRRKQPINGIIIGISLPELMKASANEIEWQAQNIRSRLDDVIKHVGLQCPVYVIFTKCDLVTGFVESFGQLNRDQADQILGYTLSSKQMADAQARTHFDQEFKNIIHNLMDFRDSRSNIAPSESRDDIYLYPLEMNTAGENLALFLSKVFWQHPFQKTPLFRGFYFTSGTQDGIPEDFVSKKVSDEFNLSMQSTHQHKNETESKGYFIKKLFKDIITQDQHMARRITWVALHDRWVRFAAIGIVCFSTLLAMYGIWAAYDDSEQNLLSLAAQKIRLSSLNWSTGDKDVFSSQIERFRQTIVDLETRAMKPGISNLWMDQSHRVLPGAHSLYSNTLAPAVKDRVYIAIEEQLRLMLKDNTPILEREEAAYDALRAYALFTDCRNTLNLSSQIFWGNYLAKAYTSFPDEKASSDLRAHMPFFAKSMTWLASRSKGDEVGKEIFAKDPRLMDQVRKLLASTRTPTAINIFRDIKRKGEDKLATMALKSEVNPAEYSYFDVMGRAGLQDIYTIQAWNAFFKDYIEGKKWDSGPDCTMGDYGIPAGTDLNDDQKEVMANQVKQIYFDNYYATWLQFINELNLKPFKNLTDASRVLEGLDNKHSQMIRLLKQASDQTQFTNLKRLGGYAGGGGQAIDQRFEDVRWLVEDKEGQKAMAELCAAYRQIATELNSVKNDTSKIRELAAKTIDKAPSQSLADGYKKIDIALSSSNLKSESSPIREALRRLLKRPIDRALEALLADTQIYLNKRWSEEIYSKNPAKQEISADIISSFFKEGGTFWSFFEAQLHPFVDKQTLQIATTNGMGLKLSESALNSFRQAKELREALTQPGGGGSFDVRAITPVNGSKFPGFDYITFEIGAKGQEGIERWKKNAPFSEGHAFTFTWPGPNPGGGAYIRLIDEPGFPFTFLNAKARTKGYLGWDGPGGWNRLLRAASVNGRRYTWRVHAQNDPTKTKDITFEITFTGGPGNKIARGIIEFDCPPKLD